MFDQLIIRKALPTDINRLIVLLGFLFSIESDFSGDEAKQRCGLELMLECPAGLERCILVAEYQGTVIGMCTAQILISTAEGGKAALLEDLIVQEEFRGMGVGRKLVSAIEKWADSQDAKRLELFADRNNTPALEFYQKLGWLQTQLVCLHKK
jgi:GNAT superfamily N-acetyltransferase